MESRSLPLPGYAELVPGRLYLRQAQQDVPGRSPERTAEILSLARVRVVAPEETYALFASTAQNFMNPRDPTRVPTDFDLAVCQLPGEVINRLAEGPDSARHLLAPFVKATEAGRLPPRAGLLEIGCLLAPREPCERVARSYGPERYEDAILRVVTHPCALRSYWGHRWTAYVALKNGVVPRPWRIISGYEGPFGALRPIEAGLLAEAEECVASIYEMVHTPEQLARIGSRLEVYAGSYHALLNQWLLAKP